MPQRRNMAKPLPFASPLTDTEDLATSLGFASFGKGAKTGERRR